LRKSLDCFASFAMTKHPCAKNKRKPPVSKESEQTFTPEDFQQRFDAAAQAAQREYCDIFQFWRTCRRKACRRAKACGGDALSCLQRGFAQVPEEASERALARVVAATAADADRPTQLARQMSPQSFYLWSLKVEQRPKQVYTVG
jgi:hypothetical protein